jgi:hypothetical protein
VLQELERGDLVPLLPALRPVEERFYVYQKKTRAGLLRQRSLTQYLQSLSPQEFHS